MTHMQVLDTVLPPFDMESSCEAVKLDSKVKAQYPSPPRHSSVADDIRRGSNVAEAYKGFSLWAAGVRRWCPLGESEKNKTSFGERIPSLPPSLPRIHNLV